MYQNVTDIIDSRIYNNFQVQVDAAGQRIEDAFREMHIISANIIYLGSPTMDMLNEFNNNTDTLIRENARKHIESTLILYEFNSTSVGLISIVDLTMNKILLSNGIRQNLDFQTIPDELNVINNTILHSPHNSFNNLGNGYVLSTFRPFTTSFTDHQLAIYMETSLDFLPEIFKNTTEKYKSDSSLILSLTDSAGTILFSSDSKLLPIGQAFSTLLNDNTTLDSNYHPFRYFSNGWTVLGLVDNSYYNQVYLPLLIQIGLSMLVLLMLNITLSILLWRSVMNPIRDFSSELKNDNKAMLYKSHKTLEFDEYRDQFNKLRMQIQQLISETEANARRNASLENELLLSRINPHFLHNMLDNIKWLARKNGANEVADLVVAINNLLHYNLGKQKVTTLREEIQVVDDYLTLQDRMLSFNYKKNIVVCENTLNMQFPCFILQPMIENSLLHGYKKDFGVNLSITEDEKNLKIEVMDNGSGMDAQTLDQLQQLTSTKYFDGMGIGMTYVCRSLKLMYGKYVHLSLESHLNQGTKIIINLLKDKKEWGDHIA